MNLKIIIISLSIILLTHIMLEKIEVMENENLKRAI